MWSYVTSSYAHGISAPNGSTVEASCVLCFGDGRWRLEDEKLSHPTWSFWCGDWTGLSCVTCVPDGIRSPSFLQFAPKFFFLRGGLIWDQSVGAVTQWQIEAGAVTKQPPPIPPAALSPSPFIRLLFMPLCYCASLWQSSAQSTVQIQIKLNRIESSNKGWKLILRDWCNLLECFCLLQVGGGWIIFVPDLNSPISWALYCHSAVLLVFVPQIEFSTH